MTSAKPNRNDPCPCGSGKKYKQCCLLNDESKSAEQANINRRRFNLPEVLKSATTMLANSQLEEAKTAFNEVLEIDPKNLNAIRGLGTALRHLKDYDGALRQFKKSLRLQPSALAYAEIGDVLLDDRRYAEAEENYRESIRLYPRMPSTYNNLGLVLDMQSRFVEQEKCFEKAISLLPDYLPAHDSLLFCLPYSLTYSTTRYLHYARRYGDMISAKARPYRDWLIETPSGASTPLNIGIVSGDLCNHPVGYFIEAVLASLDAQRVRIHAYHNRLAEDELSARLKSHCHKWINITGTDDETAAKQIREDKVHILIDLAGHSHLNRLGIFAWKPAPVSVSWLGFFASTGVPAIDYILTDPVAVPPGEENQFTETPYHLPNTRLCYTPPDHARELAVSPLPALSNGVVTFGCFQQPRKINIEVLELWAQVLDAVPNSRILIKHHDVAFAEAKSALLARMSKAGIPMDRIVPEPPSSHLEYMESHNRVDMVLDTFPFPGGTTTCESMWMGVPTLTLSGYSMLSRQGESLLSAAGLSEWIAKDKTAYVAKAKQFTSDLAGLSALRQKLREQMRNSPLMDAPQFAQNLENALYDIWSKHQERNQGS